MANKNNELKIELYPDREPRYEFPKSSIKNIISKDVLSHSLDINKELGFLNENVPILNGFYTAHTNHYPIRIKPDDIWLLIVQSFSHHVNINSEKLRNMFVNFEGKKELVVSSPISSLDQVDRKVLEDFSEQINEKMKDYLGEELLNILTPDFSTTNYDNLIVCKISIMGAFKKYFDYTLFLCGCGVPYLILEGTAEDYQKILTKSKFLSKYDFDWYINKIIPHLHKMIEAKEGKIDTEYFQNMIQNKEAIEYKSDRSGRDEYSYKVDHLSGWFLNFFAYWGDGEGDYEKFNESDIGVKDFKKLPSQMLIVPFKIIDRNKKTYLMKYKVGFVGCDQNKKNEVFPITGWIVSPSTEKERNSKI